MKEASGRTVQLDEVSEPSEPRTETTEVVPPVIPMKEPVAPALDTGTSEKLVTKPSRQRLAPEWYADEVFILEDDEPMNYKEAMTSPNSTEWLEGMKSEMESMYGNQVWDLVIPPEGVKPIEFKWIFKCKTGADGNVTIHKARLVAKGFRQVQGVDYDETFSPMLKSVRILLAIAAYFDYEIWQMDVKTTFLNRNLEENVCMIQPEGFMAPEDDGKVCKLKRSIYGLKQASQSWNLRFDEVVKSFGFI